MISEIRKGFEKLESQKAAMLSGVSDWAEPRLLFRLDPDGWCALKVLDHLLKVEQAFLGQVRTNLTSEHPVLPKERMMAWVVRAVMLSPMRIKVPTGAEAVVPTGEPELETTRRHWDLGRTEMAELLERIGPTETLGGVFRHPVSGWMSMPQALGFLSAHLRHHEYQIGRLKRATSSSAVSADRRGP